jgi:hypothetical protein
MSSPRLPVGALERALERWNRGPGTGDPRAEALDLLRELLAELGNLIAELDHLELCEVLGLPRYRALGSLIEALEQALERWEAGIGSGEPRAEALELHGLILEELGVLPDDLAEGRRFLELRNPGGA